MDDKTAPATISLLIVEDIPAQASLMKLQLEKLGYDARIAASGEEALRLVADWSFDFILLDIKMPGISGLDVMRRLKSVKGKGNNVPRVIVLTGYLDVQTFGESAKLGAVEILQKPARAVEIDRLIQEHINY